MRRKRDIGPREDAGGDGGFLGHLGDTHDAKKMRLQMQQKREMQQHLEQQRV